jgi:hypothetical protein
MKTLSLTRRAPLFLAVMLVVGLVARGAPGLGVSADQTGRPIAGAECLQDFPTAALPDPHATVVMCGLDNPRGLAFGAEGSLYVAEAGRGGFGLSDAQCFTGAAGGSRCYGPTGAISRLWNGVQERVATGLPSHASVQGVQAIGPADIAIVGIPYVTMGLQQPPAVREQYPFLAGFARLIQVLPTGGWRSIADLGAHEAEHDPDHVFYTNPRPDSNPFGLLAAPAGRAFLIADAGGNSLLHVAANGDISTYAVFEPHVEGTRRRDPVPTSVERGPDGAYYVGELTAFPPTPGAATIYRIDTAGASPEVCLSGFTLIIDIAFDNRGNLYVLQYGPQGTLHRVAPHGPAASGGAHQAGICAQYAAGEHEILVSGRTNATALAVGPDGAVYVSNRGIFPATGQVIRFDP